MVLDGVWLGRGVQPLSRWYWRVLVSFGLIAAPVVVAFDEGVTTKKVAGRAPRHRTAAAALVTTAPARSVVAEAPEPDKTARLGVHACRRPSSLTVEPTSSGSWPLRRHQSLALAAAREDEVTSAWSGPRYYRAVREPHKRRAPSSSGTAALLRPTEEALAQVPVLCGLRTRRPPSRHRLRARDVARTATARGVTGAPVVGVGDSIDRAGDARRAARARHRRGARDSRG